MSVRFIFFERTLASSSRFFSSISIVFIKILLAFIKNSFIFFISFIVVIKAFVVEYFNISFFTRTSLLLFKQQRWITMISFIIIIFNFLMKVFQISDFLKVAKLFYSIEKVKFIIIEIINKRFRSFVLKEFIIRTTQRALSAKFIFYSVNWIINRSKFVTNIRIFVIEYNN